MGDGVVVVDVAVDASAGVGEDAIAKGGVADARASEGVEGDVGIGKPTEGEDGESGAEAVAGETDLGVRMLQAIGGDEGVDLLPDLIQGVLKAAMDEAWRGEEMADEGEMCEWGCGVLRDGAVVGFVNEQDVGVGEEIVGIVGFGSAKSA